jgi:hypothetical protein
MNLYVRTLSCLALLGMSLAALSQYRPAWAVRMSLDWWSLPELCEQVHNGKEKGVELDRTGEGSLARLAAKEEVTQDLLAGRLTLPQAAGRFRALDASSSAPLPPVSDHFAGMKEEERLCRQVIGWAESAAMTNGSPDVGRTTRQRLESELNVLKEKNHGVITLPE